MVEKNSYQAKQGRIRDTVVVRHPQVRRRPLCLAEVPRCNRENMPGTSTEIHPEMRGVRARYESVPMRVRHQCLPCACSSLYIQLVWSSWNFGSFVITRRLGRWPTLGCWKRTEDARVRKENDGQGKGCGAVYLPHGLSLA